MVVLAVFEHVPLAPIKLKVVVVVKVGAMVELVAPVFQVYVTPPKPEILAGSP
jgi:hypothetical protein